jgi:hypothetical protein
MSRENFKLLKFKLIQGGGAEIHYDMEEVDGYETFYDKVTYQTGKVIHPDLMNVLNQMKPMFAKAYDYSFIRDIILKAEFGATQDQAVIAENTYQEILKKINMTGAAMSGSKDKKGCIITATYISPTGKKRGVVTERIGFNLQKYGFEEELERLFDDLEEEAFSFIFENKRAKITQGSLFNTDGATPTDQVDGKAAAAGAGNEKDDDPQE